MAKDYVSYSKQRDASAGQDKWAKIKPWKDPMGGSDNVLMGNTSLKGKPPRGTLLPQSKGYGSSSVDGASDRTYGNLNKPSDSTA